MQTTHQPKLLMLLALISLMALLYLPRAILTPFSSHGEPREALAAQAVFAGEWILPTRYGTEIVTKPPMAHWLMALSSLPFGKVTEFSTRIPSLFLGILTILLLFQFLSREISTQHALTSTLLLATSGLWIRSSIVSRIDMTLTGFLVSALLLFFLWEKRKCNGFTMPSGIALLLTGATLCKGPMGIVLPGMIMTLYLVTFRYSPLPLLRALCLIYLPTVLLSSIWYFLAFKTGGDNFLEVFLSENVRRFSGTMMTGKQPHEHSVFYLFGSLLVGFLPYTFFLFFLPWKRLRINLRKAPKIVLFSGIVSIVFVLFFSIPASKRAEYLLPAYPFMAIIFGYIFLLLSHEFSQATKRFSLFLLSVPVLLTGAILLLIAFHAVAPESLTTTKFYGQINFALHAFSHLSERYTVGVFFLLLLPALTAMHVLYHRAKYSESAFPLYSIGCFSLTVMIAGMFLIPQFGRELSPRDFAQQIDRELPKNAKTRSLDNYYGLNFYLQRRLLPIDTTEDFKKLPFYLVLKESDQENLRSTLPDNLQEQVILTSIHSIHKPGRRYLLVMVRNVDESAALY